MTTPAPPDMFDSGWVRTLGASALFGAFGAVAALAFVALTAAGERILWPDQIEPDAFSGSWRSVVIATAAGVLVGIVHRIDRNAREENVFLAVGSGTIDRRSVAGGVVIALVTLVGGFSLGPEVPTGMAAAGLAAWWGQRRQWPEERRRAGVRTAITGAWGGLFTAPFVATLLNVELGIGTRIIAWRALASDATAAIAGFAVFFAVDAGWSNLLRLLTLAEYDLELWHFLVALGLGFAGAILATIFKLTVLATRRLAQPLKDRPLTRSTIAGVIMGVVAYALPLTLFLGTDGLAQVTEDPESIGVALIAVSALVKILVTGGALSFGFVGGPVFPLLFVGGAFGSVLFVVAPTVPQALAVPALMAAVAAAVIPAPLSLAGLCILIGGIPATQAAPVLTASFTAFIVGRMIESAVAQRQTATPAG